MLERLAGTWRLRSSRFERPDGTTLAPWGDDPVGTVVIDPAGFLSAQIMERDREAPADGGAPPRGYLAYFGPCRFDAARGLLETTVEGALAVEMVGSLQRRHATLEGDVLTLRTMPLASGAVGTLTWERARPR